MTIFLKSFTIIVTFFVSKENNTMAKKAVATFAAKAGAKTMVRCIKMDKSPKTGAYVFTEQLVEEAKVKDFFDGKK